MISTDASSEPIGARHRTAARLFSSGSAVMPPFAQNGLGTTCLVPSMGRDLAMPSAGLVVTAQTMLLQLRRLVADILTAPWATSSLVC